MIIFIYRFKFDYEGKDFDLKAESAEEKAKWVRVLNLCREEQLKNQSTEDNEGSTSERKGTFGKGGHKASQLEKEDLDLIKQSGVSTSTPDDKLSDTCLSLKNIDKSLNFSKNEIKTRTYYGFLGKRHKYKKEYYQKRWFFIISSRPLSDVNYANDDTMLEGKQLPGDLPIDTLHYYQCDYDTDTSEVKGIVPLVDCHEIQREDREDKKFYIILDLGDRKYEMQSDFRGERDSWFEVLVNSRRTAKEIKASLTGKPRNLTRVLGIIEQEGIVKLKDICEKEQCKCVFDTTDM
jgi:hypothetical protein